VTLKLSQSVVMDILDDDALIFSANTDTKSDGTAYSESFSATVALAAGAPLQQVLLGGVVEAQALYLLSDRDMVVRLVPPGHVAADCLDMVLVGGKPTTIGLKIMNLYVANPGASPVSLTVACIGLDVAGGAVLLPLPTNLPTGPAGGDLTGTYPSPTLVPTGVTPATYPKVTVDAKGRVTAGTALAQGDLPVMSGDTGAGGAQGAVPAPLTGYAAAGKFLKADGTWAVPPQPSNLPPTGAAGGDLAGTYPSPQLAPSGVSAGTYSKVTVDAKGRVTNGAQVGVADIPVVQGSGTGHAAGLVPDPGSSPGTSRFLREDGQWQPSAPGGAAGGALTGTYPNPTLAIAVVDTANLVSTAVTPGTYPKVTVDAKGRVTAGSALVAGDLPTIPLSKLATVSPNRALVSDGSGNPAAGSATDTEVGYLSGATSNLQTQISAKQAQDADLDALAAITAIGLLARTANGAATVRTLQAAAGEVTISNPAGTAGDPTIGLAATGITAGTFGAADKATSVTVDAKGRLTGLTLLAIQILSSQVSDFGTAAATVADARITLQKATANGLATLDGSGKIPASQLTVGAMDFLGLWDAAANAPTLNAGTGLKGDFYKVSVTGTHNFGSGAITFRAGDSVIYDGSTWVRSGSDDSVNSVNGQVGAVALTTDTVPEGGAQYFTTERAQDAIGAALLDTATVAFTYNDAANQISAALVALSVTDAHISASASIALTKLAAITPSRAVVADVSGKMVASAATAAEVAFLSGVTSAIQAQLNGKEATIVTLPIAKGGTNSDTALNNNRVITSVAGALVEAAAIAASKALASDTNGLPVASTTTAAELAFLAGVTSAVQTQINGKQVASADLTAVAGTGFGIVAHTASGTASARTITGTADISVANGDGVADNPTIDLINTAVTPGTYGDQEKKVSITVDAKGRVTAASQLVPMQLQNISADVTVPDGYTWIRGPKTALTGTTKVTLLGSAVLFFAR